MNVVVRWTSVITGHWMPDADPTVWTDRWSAREARVYLVPAPRAHRVYGMIEQNQIYVTRQGEVFHFSRLCAVFGAVNPDWFRDLRTRAPTTGKVAAMRDNDARILCPCRFCAEAFTRPAIGHAEPCATASSGWCAQVPSHPPSVGGLVIQPCN